MIDDSIRRSDVIDKLMHIIPYKRYHNGEYILLLNKKECLSAIKAIPSVDRPQGEWLDYAIPLEDGGAMPIQVCNLCKTFYPLAYTGGGHRFCPNCGARMKGADDDNN